MARPIHTTLELHGELVAQGPLHIGGAHSGLVIDMPLVVNGQGQHYLPGTSLAGALRHWVRQHLSDIDDTELWGGHADDSAASCVIVDDAPLIDPSVSPELWHGVAIDRRSQTAMAGLKFDREVLPKGSRFVMRLAIDARHPHELENARKVLGHIAAAMQQGAIRLGAATTRGLGELVLQTPRAHETPWHSRAGVLARLRSEPQPDLLPQWLAQAPPPRRRALDITIHWKPRSPVMCKAGVDGVAVDQLPMTSATGHDRLTPVLPGSAIKGALRSHAERIMRTLLGRSASDLGEHASHMEQIDLPLVRELFGAARATSPQHPGAAVPASQGRRGALRVATCYARQSLSRAQWQALASRNDAWQGSAPPPGWQRAHHIAIERWTGSPVSGALYSAVEPRIDWEPIRLSLAPEALQEAPHATDAPLARMALLWQLLRDLAAGNIPLGFGTNRGYGDVGVERIELDGLPLPGQSHIQIAVAQDRLQVPDGPFAQWLRGPCSQAWTQQLARHANPQPQEHAHD